MNNKIKVRSPVRPQPKGIVRPNFQALWTRLMTITMSSGDERFRAVLLNHTDKKEYICRKLGVVTEADVQRILNSKKAK